jgi:hypothetical protein
VIPQSALAALTAPGADRVAVLEAFLRETGATPVRTILAGSHHLAVRFGETAYDPRFRTKLLVAHHDCVAGSPGALDNGAACLQLAALAGRLLGREDAHNTVILFTDSEESTKAGKQGSFSVARALSGRMSALIGEVGEPPAVFVFDVTGRGDTPLLSTTALDLLEARGLGETDQATAIRSMSAWAGRALRKGAGQAPFSISVPWSDDLGFAMGGIPAITITLLPRVEAENYKAYLTGFSCTDGGGTLPGQYPVALPYTWAKLHGSEDNSSLLEEKSFALMDRILDAFAELQIPRVRRIR